MESYLETPTTAALLDCETTRAIGARGANGPAVTAFSGTAPGRATLVDRGRTVAGDVSGYDGVSA